MNPNGDKAPRKFFALEPRGKEKRSWDRLLKVQYLIRPGTITWTITGITALLLVLIVTRPRAQTVETIYNPPPREGEAVIAIRDLKIPADLEVPDKEGTAIKQAEAEAKTKSIYDYDPNVPAALKKQVAEFFLSFRELYPTLATDGRRLSPDAAPIMVPSVFLPEKEQELLRSFLEELTPDDLAILKKASFSPEIEQAIASLVELPYRAKAGPEFIVPSKELLLKEKDKGISARRINAQPDEPGIEIANLEPIKDLATAREQIGREASALLAAFNLEEQAVILKIAKGLVEPNLTFNKKKSEEAKAEAVAEVKPLYYKFKKNEIIVRRGDRLSPEMMKKIDAIIEAQQGENPPSFRDFGLFILIIGFLSTLINFAKRNVRKFRLDPKDMVFLASVLVIGLGAMKGINFLSRAAQQNFLNVPEGLNYYYLIPLAGAAMLVRMVLNSEIALIFSIVLAVLGGMVAENSLLFGGYTLVGCMVAADEVRYCRQRSTILRAGVILGLVNVLLIMLISMITNQFLSFNSLLFVNNSLFLNALFGLFGGLFVAVIVTGLVPVAEFLFAYATDIKLLELLNQDNPLLKELSMHTPGTHQHALMVANLAENAAKAIGANPLLARVCAMYHDIGKMNKPLYFAENQWDGHNIHERLSPSMSTLIIHNHVKEGVELAEKHKLPRVVTDAIRQHHGTSLLAFFFDKAKEQNDTGIPIDEIDFRYPGPRPQTRETAIIMLADVVESAARSIRDPNPPKLLGMVQKLINRFFTDGQLDECDLTLKNLHEIARSFNTTLGAIYHHRPEYPQSAIKGAPADKKKKAETDADKLKDKGTANREDQPDKDEEESENYLKRLGL
jgi:hypothetical protein